MYNFVRKAMYRLGFIELIPADKEVLNYILPLDLMKVIKPMIVRDFGSQATTCFLYNVGHIHNMQCMRSIFDRKTDVIRDIFSTQSALKLYIEKTNHLKAYPDLKVAISGLEVALDLSDKPFKLISGRVSEYLDDEFIRKAISEYDKKELWNMVERTKAIYSI